MISYRQADILDKLKKSQQLWGFRIFLNGGNYGWQLGFVTHVCPVTPKGISEIDFDHPNEYLSKKLEDVLAKNGFTMGEHVHSAPYKNYPRKSMEEMGKEIERLMSQFLDIVNGKDLTMKYEVNHQGLVTFKLA